MCINRQIRVLVGNYKTNKNKNITFVFSVPYCEPKTQNTQKCKEIYYIIPLMHKVAAAAKAMCQHCSIGMPFKPSFAVFSLFHR